MNRVFGSRISYYTGKLETYLRFRGIDYELLPMTRHDREIRAGAGAVQAPVLQLDDGRWLSDTTPILAWFDAEQDGPSIYPSDPAMRFVALLLEDYADEWLWRLAMHYRWSFRPSRQYASGVLADELVAHIIGPRFVKRMVLIVRQLGGFVWGDGVSRTTRAHVDGSYTKALDLMEAALAGRRFLLGDAPTIVDFGFMAPMFRHFSMDPDPAEIMRARAPGVYAWVARMWNTKASPVFPNVIADIDPPVASLLVEAAETHLVQLRENARAWAQGLRRYDQQIQGCQYRNVPSSRYRVWCLEELRRAWAALDEDAQAVVRQHLPEQEASVLWDAAVPKPSGYDPERRAPFNRAINVFGTGVPPR